MSLSELAALARRHFVAVAIVIIVAGGVAYSFRHAPPTYQESATLVLTAPGPHPYSSFGYAMIIAGETATDWLSGPQGQRQLRRDGVTGSFSVGLVNSSNQEYPYYATPYINVSASASDSATAHRTFMLVTQAVNNYLAARQRQEGVAPAGRITTALLDDTGPLLTPGSRIRTFAGLAMLTLVAMYLLASFLDRHPIRPRMSLYSQWRSIHRAPLGKSSRPPARQGAV